MPSLQPENILLDTKSDQVKLIDFSSSQEMDSNASVGFCANSGTSPEFLAPEIISGGAVGPHTDMWGFGVLLYVALRQGYYHFNECMSTGILM